MSQPTAQIDQAMEGLNPLWDDLLEIRELSSGLPEEVTSNPIYVNRVRDSQKAVSELIDAMLSVRWHRAQLQTITYQLSEIDLPIDI